MSAIESALLKAMDELPDGYQIMITVVKGEIDVCMLDSDGKSIEVIPTDMEVDLLDLELYTILTNAIAVAKGDK